MSTALGVGTAAIFNPLLAIGIVLLGAIILLIVVRPSVGGLLIILSSPLNTITWGGLGFNVRMYVIFTLVTFVGLLLQACVGRRKLCRTPLDIPILLLWLVLALTLLINNGNSFGNVLLVVFAFMVVMYFALVNAIRDKRAVQLAVYAVALAGDAVAGLGFLQIAGQYIGLEGELLRPVHFDVVEFGRPIGTFTDPGWFGIYAMFVFLLILPLAWRRIGQHQIFLSLSLVIQMAALVLSFARAAWVGTIFGLFVFALWLGLKRRLSIRTVLVAVGCFLAMLFVWAELSPSTFGSFVDRASGADVQSSARSRMLVTQDTLMSLDQNFLFGYGIGSWDSDVLDERVRMSPNMIVSIIHDAGALGVAAWLLVLFTLLGPLIANSVRLREDGMASYNQGVLQGIVGILVSFQFSAGFHYEWFWVAVALGAAIARVARSAGIRNSTPLRSVKGIDTCGSELTSPQHQGHRAESETTP